MELPEGYEAHVVPRSSTYKHFGIIQTNSMESLMNLIKATMTSGFPAFALRDTDISKGSGSANSES